MQKWSRKIKVQVVLALATLTILAILHVGNHVVTPPMSLLMNTNTTINANVSKISVCPASKPPIKSVVFLKTHKTGSESVSGILRKYAIIHIRGINEQVRTFDFQIGSKMLIPALKMSLHSSLKQTVAIFIIVGTWRLILSTKKNFRAFNSNPYAYNSDARYQPVNPTIPIAGYGEPGAHYEMIATHMTWNASFVESVIPKTSDRLTFTILRSPTTQLESSWKFFYPWFNDRGKVWPKESGDTNQVRQLIDLLKNPDRFFEQAMLLKEIDRTHILRSQLHDFGFGADIYKRSIDKATIDRWIAQIEQDFDLVMITEYFDYSLALLALELCWPLEELAYLRSNEGHHVNVTKPSNLEELIRNFNYPEYQLYEHFNATLWRKIDAIGLDRVNAISNEIIQLSNQLETKCVAGYRQIRLGNNKMAKEAIPRNDSTECLASVLWGKRQTKMLMKRQRELIKRENWLKT